MGCSIGGSRACVSRTASLIGELRLGRGRMNIEMIVHARDLLVSYPVVFCDVWGVLHDGVREYSGAGDALERYRAQGGTVVLLSNAPVPAAAVAKVLEEKQVRRSAWDAIVSSGDITRQHIAERGYKAVHHIGPDRSLSLFDDLKINRTALSSADAIVCTGLVDDTNDTAEIYRPLLAPAVAAKMPFVCANPDLVVDVGGTLFACAGAIGTVYATMGGEVYWAGKPHKPAYDMALSVAGRLLNRSIAARDVLAIGDAVATDMAGAAIAEIDALFVANGIHRHEACVEGMIDPVAIARLFEGGAVVPRAAMAALTW